MKHILIFAIVLLAATGCSQKQNDEFITVDVTKSSYPKKELVLQDFMDVEYIPLETNDEFITHGSVKAIGKEFILATNSNRLRDGNIFVFNQKGKALRKINRMGQGGEEYSNIIEIILDENRQEIYVHNQFERKIQVYDLEGNYQRTLKYRENTKGAFYTDIIDFDENNFLCYDAYNRHKERKKFVLLSKQDGSITYSINIPFQQTKIFMQTDKTKQQYAFPDYFCRVVPYNNKFLLLEHSSDTIYTFSKECRLHPFLVRTPPIHSMDPEIYLLFRLVSDRYLFMETMKNVYDFNTGKGFPKDFLMYDQQELSVFKYKVYNGDYTTKKEIYMNTLRLANNQGEYWTRLEAADLVEAYEKGELKGKLKEIAANLKEDDNPVVMLVKHKR